MRVFFVAGESSGDQIAGKVCIPLRQRGAEIYAWGGEYLQTSGAVLLRETVSNSQMGFYEIFRKIRSYYRLIADCKKDILRVKPGILVLVDFSGFNMSLLPWAKKQGLKTVYLVPPKVWASRIGRLRKLQKYCDRIVVVYPFEQEFYRKQGVDTSYFGHPLFERIRYVERSSLSRKKILLAPGSRLQEIERILPEMLNAVKHYEEYRVVISQMSHLSSELYLSIVSHAGKYPVELRSESLEKLADEVDFALVASGTATVELCLKGVPQLVCYKTHWLNYILARILIRVPYISLVNLLAGRRIVAELIQHELNEENLRTEIERIQNPGNLKDYHDFCRKLSSQLSQEGCAQNIVRYILE